MVLPKITYTSKPNTPLLPYVYTIEFLLRKDSNFYPFFNFFFLNSNLKNYCNTKHIILFVLYIKTKLMII